MRILLLLLSSIALAQYTPPVGAGAGTCGSPDCNVTGNLTVGGNATIGTTFPVTLGQTGAITGSNLIPPGFPGNGYLLSWGPSGITNATCVDNTFTLLNAELGNHLAPAFPVLASGLFATMFISAADTVTVRVCNLSGSTASIPTSSWGAKLIK